MRICDTSYNCGVNENGDEPGICPDDFGDWSGCSFTGYDGITHYGCQVNDVDCCGNNMANFGEICEGAGECRGFDCDTTNRKYAPPVNCVASSCTCPSSSYEVLSDTTNYCNNCNTGSDNHCGDGSINCGETCDGNVCSPASCDYTNEIYYAAVSCNSGCACPAPTPQTGTPFEQNCQRSCIGTAECRQAHCRYSTQEYASQVNCAGGSCALYSYSATGYCANCPSHCGDNVKNCGEACDPSDTANNADCQGGTSYICSSACSWVQNSVQTDSDGDGNVNTCDVHPSNPCSIINPGDNCAAAVCQSSASYCDSCGHCGDNTRNCGEACDPNEADNTRCSSGDYQTCSGSCSWLANQGTDSDGDGH
ncbi:MAG: hypothetical protein QF535_23855, partial [Anaerolineales bacterium]|nr:hypothetical protein [Anaerolineales bacterium]